MLVNTFGTGKAPDAEIERAVLAVFPTHPGAIIKELGLLRPIYMRTAAYGHFGRAPESDGGFSWEKIDRVDALKKAIGK